MMKLYFRPQLVSTQSGDYVPDQVRTFEEAVVVTGSTVQTMAGTVVARRYEAGWFTEELDPRNAKGPYRELIIYQD